MGKLFLKVQKVEARSEKSPHACRLMRLAMPLGGRGWNEHDYYELAFCVQGRGALKTLDKKIPFRKGTVIFTNRSEAHCWFPSVPSDVFFLQLSATAFKKINLEACGQWPRLFLLDAFWNQVLGGCESLFASAPAAVNLTASLVFIQQELKEKQIDSEELLLLEIKKIFLMLRRDVLSSSAHLPPPVVRNPDGVVEAVQQFLLKEFKEALTPSILSETFLYSADYLGKAFKQATGYSLSEYLAEIRIKEASRLLLSTDAKVVDIAQRVGFNNLSYFNRLFKNLMNVTPAVFRKTKMST